MAHSNSNPSSLPKRILSQFATYRIAIARAAFVTTFLVISLLAALLEVSRAQCPPSTVPYPGYSWSGPYTTYEEIAGTSCEVQISYCVRTEYVGSIPGPNYYIDTIIPISSSCDSLTGSQVILGGIASFEEDTNIFLGGYRDRIPICNGFNFQTILTTTAFCWTKVDVYLFPDEMMPTQEFAPCPGATSYCVKTCNWCRNLGLLEPVSCSSNGTFNGECSAVPLGGGFWWPGECYNIDPCH